MAKPITKTTVKLTNTHNHLAITVRYVNGEVLKISSTFSRERISFERPTTFEGPRADRSHLNAILKHTEKFREGENNGQRFERIAKVLETTTNIIDASEKLAAA